MLECCFFFSCCRVTVAGKSEVIHRFFGMLTYTKEDGLIYRLAISDTQVDNSHTVHTTSFLWEGKRLSWIMHKARITRLEHVQQTPLSFLTFFEHFSCISSSSSRLFLPRFVSHFYLLHHHAGGL